MHLLSSVNFVRVCVQVWQTCSSKLEIKTLCGTWLMIRWELKQKADESREKRKRERRRRKRQMVWAVGEDACCLWGEGVSDCLCCSPQACVEAAVLSRCQTDLSHWLASVSRNVPKREHNWGNWSQETCEGHLEELLWWAADVHREGCVQTQRQIKTHTLFLSFFISSWKHTESHPRAKIMTNRYRVEFVFVVQWFTSLITYTSLPAGDLSHKSDIK